MENIPPADEYVQSSLIMLQAIPDLSPSASGILFFFVIFLIACSALISSSEVAYFSLQQDQLDELEEEGSNKALLVNQLLQQPKYLLSTMLIANNLVNIGIIICSTFLLDSLIAGWPTWMVFVVQVVLITSVLLLLGEIAPKVYATNNNKKVALLMANPLRFLKKIFHVLNLMLVSSGNTLEKRISKEEQNMSADELNQAIDLTIDKEDVNKQEHKKILKGLIKFGNISVKQIMCNRTNVTALDVDQKYSEILPIVINSGFSRIPVYDDSFDNIKGILYTKDLLDHTEETDEFKWQDLLRKAIFVPENKKISNLLKEFQAKKVHLAIVVDEYGGTEGIVTLEDILEEIVGDIKDEFDVESINCLQINENEYIMEGKTHLADIVNLLHLEPDCFDQYNDADSLAGLILELEGGIPKYKSQISYKQFKFTIESVGKKSINRIRVEVDPNAAK